MADQKIKLIISLKVPAQEASAKAPLGPTLGQYGIPIADFCNQFNSSSSEYETGLMLKCILYIYDDLSYNFKILNPNNSELVKKILNIETGLHNPKKVKLKTDILYNYIITPYLLYEIGILQYGNLFNKSNYKKLKGLLRSMGIVYIKE